MNEIITVEGTEMQVKEWNGQRVITLEDMDCVHQRLKGTAKKNFQNNRKHFVEGEDYFELTRKELWENYSPKDKPLVGNPKLKVYVFTLSGYLMLSKSFTDDLAWNVQRQLVNSYFRLKDIAEKSVAPVEAMPPVTMSVADFNHAVETISACAAIFQSMIDYSTINYKQQMELQSIAKQRVVELLGENTEEYLLNSRIYLKNLWIDFCRTFSCSTYKDLNPLYMSDDLAKKWIQKWNYTESALLETK